MDDNQPRHAYPDDHWLLYKCPWCGAGPFHRCNVAGDVLLHRIHDARLQLVGTAIDQDAG